MIGNCIRFLTLVIEIETFVPLLDVSHRFLTFLAGGRQGQLALVIINEISMITPFNGVQVKSSCTTITQDIKIVHEVLKIGSWHVVQLSEDASITIKQTISLII